MTVNFSSVKMQNLLFDCWYKLFLKLSQSYSRSWDLWKKAQV